jgi:hypothetical protein
MQQPIVLIIKAATCSHCIHLNSVLNDVISKMKSFNPKLRFFIIELTNFQERLDTTKIPASVNYFRSWYPLIALINGEAWEIANLNKNEQKDILIRNSVILGGICDETPEITGFNKIIPMRDVASLTLQLPPPEGGRQRNVGMYKWKVELLDGNGKTERIILSKQSQLSTKQYNYTNANDMGKWIYDTMERDDYYDIFFKKIRDNEPYGREKEDTTVGGGSRVKPGRFSGVKRKVKYH